MEKAVQSMVQAKWRPLLRGLRQGVIRDLEKETRTGKTVHVSLHLSLTCVSANPEIQSASPKSLMFQG
jgi:hypothetical protein